MSRYYTRTDGKALNDNLENRTNDFISGFSDRAKLVSEQFTNVDGYLIWNEPNVLLSQDPPTWSVPPENFAALLYQCTQKMASGSKVYWGGIQIGDNYDSFSTLYVRKVYQWYDDQFHVKDPERSGGFSWPWEAINLHFHNDSRSATDIAKQFTEIRKVKTEFGDDGDVIIGEWGVTQEDFRVNAARLTNVYSRIIANKPDIMFFFSHHGVDDPVSPGELHWGIRDYVNPPIGVFVQTPPGESGLVFRLAPKNGIDGDFYTAYDTLIGS